MPETIMDRVRAVYSELLDADAQVERAEAALKAAQERRKQIATVRLPELMTDAELEEFKTLDGKTVKLVSKIRANVTNPNKAAFYRWLRDNGHGGLIKTLVEVPFGANQQSAASSLADELRREKGLDVGTKESVHPGTLESWVRARLEEGTDIPEDLVNIFEQKDVKIK